MVFWFQYATRFVGKSPLFSGYPVSITSISSNLRSLSCVACFTNFHLTSSIEPRSVFEQAASWSFKPSLIFSLTKRFFRLSVSSNKWTSPILRHHSGLDVLLWYLNNYCLFLACVEFQTSIEVIAASEEQSGVSNFINDFVSKVSIIKGLNNKRLMANKYE